MEKKDKRDPSPKSVFSIMKKVLHFITKVLMYSVFLLLLFVGFILIVYVIDLKKSSSTGVYKPPLFSAYVIISPSMVPTIKVEDAVIIRRVEADEIQKGDIITFTSTDSRYAGITVTHRVVEVIQTSKGKYMYRTKGDNNNAEDPTLVSSEYVSGKVILRIPKIGYIQYFLSQAYGWIIAIVIPCLAIVIYDIVKLVKLIAKNKNKPKTEMVSAKDETSPPSRKKRSR